MTHVGAWELGTLFVAATLGTKLSSVPLKTLRKERWYALGGFAMGALAVRYERVLQVLGPLLGACVFS